MCLGAPEAPGDPVPVPLAAGLRCCGRGQGSRRAGDSAGAQHPLPFTAPPFLGHAPCTSWDCGRGWALRTTATLGSGTGHHAGLCPAPGEQRLSCCHPSLWPHVAVPCPRSRELPGQGWRRQGKGHWAGITAGTWPRVPAAPCPASRGFAFHHRADGPLLASGLGHGSAEQVDARWKIAAACSWVLRLDSARLKPV